MFLRALLSLFSLFFCGVDWSLPAAEIAFAVDAPVHHAALAGGEAIVVTHPGNDRAVTRVTASGASVVARIDMLGKEVSYASRGSDELVVANDTWWYAALDGREGVPATTFVKSDGARVTHPTTMRGPVHAYLIALPGDEPHALDFSSGLESTLVRELDFHGTRRTWQLPRDYRIWPHMTAESLPDGRIAVVSSREGLQLFVLSDDGVVGAEVLRNGHFEQFDTAVDDGGRIAIVAAHNETGTVEAAIVDVDHPADVQWIRVREGTRVVGRRREVQVVAHPGGFVAAWIDERHERRIEAAELGAHGAGRVVDIGTASPRGDTAFFDLQAAGDQLVFWWDDGARVHRRNMPVSLGGFALLQDVVSRLCER